MIINLKDYQSIEEINCQIRIKEIGMKKQARRNSKKIRLRVLSDKSTTTKEWNQEITHNMDVKIDCGGVIGRQIVIRIMNAENRRKKEEEKKESSEEIRLRNIRVVTK